jgi:hypothetical protein
MGMAVKGVPMGKMAIKALQKELEDALAEGIVLVERQEVLLLWAIRGSDRRVGRRALVAGPQGMLQPTPPSARSIAGLGNLAITRDRQ